MNEPWWIVRFTGKAVQSALLMADYGDGRQGWASYSLLFPVDEKYPEKIKLAHWPTRDEAEAAAFALILGKPERLGQIVVEECWIKRCKRCYDCLCGEGGRRRE